MTSLRDTIDRGNAARRAGRFEEALELYRAALKAAPDDPHAASLCGLALLQLGKTEEAEPLLRKAVERAPRDLAVRMNLVSLFETQGTFARAIAVMETVVADAPGFVHGWDRLASLCMQANRPAEALAHLGRALALEPANHQIALKAAALALDLRRFDQAQGLLEHVARLAPGNADLLCLSTKLFELQSNWRAMEPAAAMWARARPGDVAAWYALATASYEIGNFRQAMDAHRRAMDIAGRDAAHLAVYAQYCVNAQDFDEASLALAEAERLDPNQVDLLSVKALVLTYRGQFEEAETYCRRCINRDPDHVPAYKVLSNLKRGRVADEDVAALRRLAQRPDLSAEHRISAALTLGDCLDARAQIDEAFAAYSQAKRVGLERAQIEGLGYDVPGHVAQVDRLISLFNSATPVQPRTSGRRPIFVIGMPRSGTTLIESVLAAHSRVLACGERVQLPIVLSQYLATRGPEGHPVPEHMWAEWVRAYWRDVAESGSADHITDKNPFNFETVGLIAQLFPDAAIVHVRRNPIETGLSIFRNEFAKFVKFTNRLEDIGRYYGQYSRLVAHWERLFGDRVTTIQYEDFVADFEGGARALVQACGLAWEDVCLERDKSARAVSTLSSVQVRLPVSAGKDRARLYRHHLGPLIDALDAAGVDLATGALRPSSPAVE